MIRNISLLLLISLTWSKQEDWLKDRLIITPHAAFYNRESFHEMREKAALEAKRVLEGHAPYNRVN